MGDLRKTPLGKLLLLQTLIGGGSPAVERIALGNPLTFGTDLARPLKSLLIPFTPQQEGTGDPSPSNIRRILPWNGLKVWNGGKNLFDGTIYRKNVDYNTGEINTSTNRLITDYIPLKAGKYTFSLKESAQITIYFYKEPSKSGYVKAESLSSWVNAPRTFTITEDRYVVIVIRNTSNTTILPSDVSDIQLEVGQTATAYEPYKPITETDISFPSPVYGGTLDVVSGVLTVTHEGLVSTWGQAKVDRKQSGYQQGRMFFTHDVPVSGQSGASATNQKCNIAEYQWDDFNETPHFYTGTREGRKCAVILIPEDTPDETEIVVSAKLKTTYEVQLTGEQITALVGDNTIWSDADGSMTCVYLVSSKYADEHPVGGLGFGFGFWNGTPDEPDDPENPDESEEPIIDDSENNQIEGEEP